MLTEQDRRRLKRELADTLKPEAEVCRIVIFGSFVDSDDPHDLDVAVFQDSNQPYLPLALKYRQLTRAIARRITLDIFPVRVDAKDGPFMNEIARGEVVYERADPKMA